MTAYIDRLLHEGVQAIRAGDRETGKEKLMKVIEEDELNEQAWLWLSAAVTEREERIICLENVLTINPDNESAIKGLQKLGAPLPVQPVPPEPEDEPAQSPVSHGRPPALADDEAWRKPLMTSASQAAESAGTVPKKRRMPQPTPEDRNLLDLLNAWGAAAIFQTREYRAEIRATNAGRLMISASVLTLMVLLLLGALTFGVTLLFTSPELLAEFDPVEQEQIRATFGDGSLMGAAIFVIAGTAGFWVNQAITIGSYQLGATIMGGTGRLIEMAHAVVIAALINILIGLFLVVVLFGVTYVTESIDVLGLWPTIIGLYGIALNLSAIVATHEEFGLGKSCLATIIGSIGVSFFLCVGVMFFSFGLSALFG